MRDEIRERIEAVRRGEVPEGYVVENHQLRPVEWGYDKIGEHLVAHDEYSNDTERYPLATSSRQGLMLQSDYYGDQRYEETTGGFHVVPEGCITYRHMSDDDVFRFNINNMGTPVLVSPEYPVFTTDGSLDKTILVEYLNGMKEFRAFCSAQKKGSTRTRMYFSRLGEFSMPIPPVAEQRRIAEILDACDRVIRQKQDLIEEKRKVKRSLMNGLLSTAEMRLPSFETDEIKDAKLASLIDAIEAGTSVNSLEAETVQYRPDRPFVLKTSCVSNGAFIPFEIKEVTEQDYGRVSCPVKAGTLIVSRMNTPSLVGACAYCDSSKDNIFLPDRLWRVTLKTSVDGRWLNYLLNTSAYQDRLHLLASGTSNSMKNISKEDFLELQIEVPSLEEQKAIAKVLMCLDRSIEALERELEQWQMKKKALMQLLLTGLVRVNA